MRSARVQGGVPGLYGGVRKTPNCDVERQIKALQADSKKNRAFASTVGVRPSAVPAYLRSLTSVQLRADTRVTNHGYRDGAAASRQAVLQSGTSVLVDGRGMPRLRCACGNPLKEPVAQRTTPKLIGRQWSSYRPANVVVVRPAPVVVKVFVIYDTQHREWLNRHRGDVNGRHDQRGKAPKYPNPWTLPPPPTTTPPTSPQTTPPTSPSPTSPTDKSPSPTDKSPSPTDKTPTDKTDSPTDKTPTDKTDSPTDKTPTDKTDSPTDKTESPTDKTPTDKTESPTDKTPTDKTESPTDETPADETSPPEETSPAGGDLHAHRVGAGDRLTDGRGEPGDRHSGRGDGADRADLARRGVGAHRGLAAGGDVRRHAPVAGRVSPGDDGRSGRDRPAAGGTRHPAAGSSREQQEEQQQEQEQQQEPQQEQQQDQGRSG